MNYRPDPAMLGTSGYARTERDWYPTPRNATDPAVAFLDEIAQGAKLKLWECAAGDGAMSEVLREAGHDVFASDIHPLAPFVQVGDFLTEAPADPEWFYNGIVTNPPYGTVALEFIERAIRHLDAGHVRFVAMLVRNEYDCASGRRHIFDDCPTFAAKIILTFRPRWIADSKGSPRHNYQWLVWRSDWKRAGRPEVRYAHNEG